MGYGQIVLCRRYVCSTCGGNPSSPVPCGRCMGSTAETRMRRLHVKIPSGVETGSHLRLRVADLHAGSGVLGALLLRVEVR
jgi:DnaJ-class molecular chaperone